MQEQNASFEHLIKSIFNEELALILKTLDQNSLATQRKYLTIKEVSKLSGIGTYTLRQLTYARAMPHRKIKSRIIFDESEIQDTNSMYKEVGWDDPEKEWDIKGVQDEIDALLNKKEEPMMIDDILRKIIKEELADFSAEILSKTKKENERYYGRTVLTIKDKFCYHL